MRLITKAFLIVIGTHSSPGPGEAGGGIWWDVAVPEVGNSELMEVARSEYVRKRSLQHGVV